MLFPFYPLSKGQNTFLQIRHFVSFLCLAPRFEEVKQKVNLFDKCFTQQQMHQSLLQQSRNIYCTESENGALSSLESFNTRSVLVSKTQKDCQSEVVAKNPDFFSNNTRHKRLLYGLTQHVLAPERCNKANTRLKISTSRHDPGLCCLISLPYCNPSNDLSGAFLGLEVYLWPQEPL